MQACKPGSVSRLLGLPIIYLVAASQPRSSSLPTPIYERATHRTFQCDRGLFDLSARKVYHAVNVTIHPVSSYLTFSPFPNRQVDTGSLFSVALSVPPRFWESLPVRKYAALCCPDFPPSRVAGKAIEQLALQR